MNQCGIKIVLDGPRSYFQDTRTGKVTKLNVENGQYTFSIWVKADGKAAGEKEGMQNENGAKRTSMQTETGVQRKTNMQTENGARKTTKESWMKGNRFASLHEDEEMDEADRSTMMDFIRREGRAQRGAGNP